MPESKRDEIERSISQALFSEWNPLGVEAAPDTAGTYASYAHDIYGLLARGASDVQVGRHLQHLERDEMHHAETDLHDVAQVLRTLRALERRM